VSFPPIEPPPGPEARVAWWSEWVRAVRNRPTLGDMIGEDRHYYGEHLFIGAETHNQMERVPRAIGRQASSFTDVLEYHEVTDLRAWARTPAAPLLIHEQIFGEHCYIVGPSGSGKSSLGIMPILIQLIRGAKTKSDSLPPPYPVVILDLKGDAALFHTVRLEAKQREQTFQFFSTESNQPTYRFNPFRGFDRGSRSVAQLCQLILDALNLNHGKGYGRSYYTERSRNVLARTLTRNRNIQSFDELHAELRETVARADIRTKGDAFELLSIIEMLTEYRQLITDPDETISSTDGIIFMPSVLENREIAYFWLPAALESISVGEIAKLVLFNLRVAAQDWKRANPRNPRNVILVIDELQRVAGENLQGILQDARSFGINAILANQSLTDLKSQTGFDLAPTIMTNTRVKFFFTSPSERDCYVYVERGKGFTEARQFPKLGNPWLKDLAPEEFAYQVELAWPIPRDEYERRDSLPFPSWDEIPGGDFRARLTKSTEPDEEPEFSDVLPRNFKLLYDEEREQQALAIHRLFAEEDAQPLQPDLFAPKSGIPAEDIAAMRDEILESVAERGPDRTRCVLSLLFQNYLDSVETAPTWKDLWRECWKETIDERRGGAVQASGKVRQTVYRAREIMARYYTSDRGRRWKLRAAIDGNEYRIILKPNDLEDSE
jgi:hypothetical protein